MTTTCYYAHSVHLYGSQQEKRDVQLLMNLGFNVINPSDAIYQNGYKEKGMMYFKDIVERCDALAFRAHIDFKIPAGVGWEIEWAIVKGMPIIELPSMLNMRLLTVEQTRDYLRELGER